MRELVDGSGDGGADDQQGDENNEQQLRDDVPNGAAPDFHTLRFDVAGVVKSDQHSGEPASRPVQWQSVGINRQFGEIGESAGSGVAGACLIKNLRRDVRIIAQLIAGGEQLAVEIVDSDTGQVLAITKTLDDPVQLVLGAALEHGFDRLLQALREDFAATGQVGAQALLFAADLVTGDEKRDEANADDERGDESQAELHSRPLSV